jgi:hypothetical protein
MDLNRMFELRAAAQKDDLRNRDIPSGPRCKCGNILTIVDRGSICRQCWMSR